MQRNASLGQDTLGSLVQRQPGQARRSRVMLAGLADQPLHPSGQPVVLRQQRRRLGDPLGILRGPAIWLYIPMAAFEVPFALWLLIKGVTASTTVSRQLEAVS